MLMINQAVITTREELERVLTLSEPELRWFSSHTDSLPFQISRYYLNLIDPSDPNDPLRRQAIPTTDEDVRVEGENLDPLAEVSHSIFPRLIHRYTNRVALLVTDRCVLYCRHCFRRRFTAGGELGVSDSELQEIGSYLSVHPEIREILLTGGDPLTLSDVRLEQIITTLRKVRNDLVIRLCTRMPVTYPARVTDELVARLRPFTSPALFLMTQFNHFREVTPESRRAIDRFVDAGIPVMNQSVLLRGVNDNVDTLERLMNDLVAIRVKPYYLFQGDLVGGTAHLRVPLEQGLEIERMLRERLSGLAMPQYAVDLPNGGGKVPLYGTGRNRPGGRGLPGTIRDDS